MRKLILTLGALCACLSGTAQDKEKIAGELAAILDTCCVNIRYEYSDAARRPLGSGTAVVQQNKYTVFEGKGTFICNGTTRWTLFSDTREIYIEKAGGKEDIFGNLASILQGVEDISYDGRNISFSMAMPGMNDRIHCKASFDRMPFKPDAEFAVRDGVLNNPAWTVTDLR